MDLFLRIALPSLAFLIGLVALGIQHWKDTPGRWKRRLVIAMPLLLMAPAVGSITLTVRDTNSRSKTAADQRVQIRGNGDNYRFRPKTAPDKTAIERQIASTDGQIDALVYELYGLTKEEIRIAEGEENHDKEHGKTAGSPEKEWK